MKIFAAVDLNAEFVGSRAAGQMQRGIDCKLPGRRHVKSQQRYLLYFTPTRYELYWILELPNTSMQGTEPWVLSIDVISSRRRSPAPAAGHGPATAARGRTGRDFNGSDIVELGKTGIKVSRLAQGTGFNGDNHSSEQTRQGKATFDRLLRHSLDQGIPSSTWPICTAPIPSSRT